MFDETNKVAVLIDAENISPKYAQLILNEAGNIGDVICKRIYGDWSSSSLSSWKTPIMDHSFNPIQQFQNTTGKNSSDSALIIDAMDLLQERKYQSICIVSSDSDFTRLASRLREEEIYVVGMGEQKTPVSFRSACNKFLYLDLLIKEEEKKEKDQKQEAKTTKKRQTKENEQATSQTDDSQNGKNKSVIISAINDIIDIESDEDGWARLADVGNILNRMVTDFDVRNFGCKKLSQVIEKLGEYETKSVSNESNQSIKVVYVRKKKDEVTK